MLMNDLVGFLQHIAEHCGLSEADRRCIREAADTIATLTAERDAMAKERDASWAAVGAWKSLAATLTAERNNAIACRRAADARDGASRNRIARLEEALREIVTINPIWNGGIRAHEPQYLYGFIEELRDTARRALRPHPPAEE